MKFPRVIGTMPDMMTTKMEENIHRKNQYYKGKKDFDRKPWQDRDQKLWNKDQKKQYSNKELIGTVYCVIDV